ncbi:MAG: hypothetical protein EZS28_051423, partial [Streblomastix strix]
AVGTGCSHELSIPMGRQLFKIQRKLEMLIYDESDNLCYFKNNEDVQTVKEKRIDIIPTAPIVLLSRHIIIVMLVKGWTARGSIQSLQPSMAESQQRG